MAGLGGAVDEVAPPGPFTGDRGEEDKGSVALLLQAPGNGQSDRHRPDVVGPAEADGAVASRLVRGLVAEDPEGDDDDVEVADLVRHRLDERSMRIGVVGVERRRGHRPGAGAAQGGGRRRRGPRDGDRPGRLRPGGAGPGVRRWRPPGRTHRRARGSIARCRGNPSWPVDTDRWRTFVCLGPGESPQPPRQVGAKVPIGVEFAANLLPEGQDRDTWRPTARAAVASPWPGRCVLRLHHDLVQAVQQRRPDQRPRPEGPTPASSPAGETTAARDWPGRTVSGRPETRSTSPRSPAR